MNDSPEASGIHDALPARTLGAIVDNASDLRPVLKSDLARGDLVVVVTKNSTYSICFLGGVRTTRIQKVTVHNSDSLPIFN